LVCSRERRTVHPPAQALGPLFKARLFAPLEARKTRLKIQVPRKELCRLLPGVIISAGWRSSDRSCAMTFTDSDVDVLVEFEPESVPGLSA